jgi:hypothetical protein
MKTFKFALVCVCAIGCSNTTNSLSVDRYWDASSKAWNDDHMKQYPPMPETVPYSWYVNSVPLTEEYVREHYVDTHAISPSNGVDIDQAIKQLEEVIEQQQHTNGQLPNW